MSPKLKRTGIVLLVLLAIIVIFIAVFQWNWVRGPINRMVTAKTGREFVISGDLHVRWFSLHPFIHMEKVRFANAAWGTEKTMFEADVAEFRIDLLKLLKKDIEIPEVALSHPYIVLEKNTDGERNWDLNTKKSPGPPPQIGLLTVDEGTLIYRDPTKKTDYKLAISTGPVKEGNQTINGVKFTATGHMKGAVASAHGTGGPILSLRDQNTPYPIDADIQITNTKAKFKGTVTGLMTFSAVDAFLSLQGRDLAELYPITGVALPTTLPPYNIAGHLSHEGMHWSYKKFRGTVGSSDLSGDFSLDTGGERPFLRGDLTSKNLDLKDLGSVIGTDPKKARVKSKSTTTDSKVAVADKTARPRHVLPDIPFRVERLRKMDADVKLSGKNIRRPEALPLDNLVVHLKLKDGVLDLDPLNFGVAGGHIISKINLNARQDIIAAKADIQFKALQLNKLFPTVKLTKSGVGAVGGHAKLAGTGNSVSKMLATADGDVGFGMAGGQISNLLLEFAGIDGEEIIKFLLAGDRNVVVRCGVATFTARKGILTTNTFVFDTTDTNIGGEGTVNLADEMLNLTLRPLPKDHSFLSLRSPLHVTGPFSHPSFRPEVGGMVARGGAAILLGLVNPLAALIPLFETGPGKDSNCGALLAMANKSGANIPTTKKR